MIPVKVDQLFLSNMGFVVILKAAEDERGIPIFIGAAEAQAIAIQLQGMKVPRPLTHDLLKNVLDYLECRLQRVEVCDIRDGTYYGRLIVEVDHREMEIDCRPSDAIALALRCDCPVLVAENVMQEAGRVMDDIRPAPGAEAGERPPVELAKGPAKTPAKPQTPLEALQSKLEKAVVEERYEDAAQLRDEINRIQKHADN